MGIFDYFQKQITVQTRAPAILGAELKNVRVDSVLSFPAAMKYRNVHQIHRSVFPFLTGVKDDPGSYQYVLLKTTSGDNLVVGIPWLVLDSIELVSDVTMVFKIEGYSPERLERIKAQLIAIGETEWTSELVTQ